MKYAIASVTMCLVMALVLHAQQEGVSHPKSSRIYELYSWQDLKGNWNFSLLPSTSSEKSVEVVFNKKATIHGVDQLKAKISKLPEGSTIALLDRLPTVVHPSKTGHLPRVG